MKKINNGELRIENVNQEVLLFGFVANKRKMGELTFIDLRDRYGITQVVVKNIVVKFTKESVLKIEGKVFERKNKNPNLKTGEIEVIANSIEVLSLAAEQLPFVIRNDLEAKEETRLKHRYLDLRRPKMYHNLLLRHKVTKAIRDFYDERNFLEVETPYLSKSTPEGARDFLVPTRNEGKFFALPQSPQLYKQLLMASGIESYFQIARCFRDEDSRKDRQPEFTQLDVEMSFVSEEEIKSMVEDMIKYIWKAVGKSSKIIFERMNYDDAINNYGSDKPDLRFKNLIHDVTNIFKDSEFNTFSQTEKVKFIYIKEVLSNKQIKKLEEIAKKNKAKGLMWATLDESKKGPAHKFIFKELKQIETNHKLSSGTILFGAGQNKDVSQALGAIRTSLGEMFNLPKENDFKFVWIENWPMFEKDAESGRLIAAHHPFTSPGEEFIESFDKKPTEARAKAYDLVLNGFEIGGGSVRINDLELQKRMFKAIGLSKESYENQFGFFLEAFKYGLPPHAGVAFGIDRLVMILAKATSIREVIAFPKNTNGIAVMESSPSNISEEQINEYHIKLK